MNSHPGFVIWMLNMSVIHLFFYFNFFLMCVSPLTLSPFISFRNAYLFIYFFNKTSKEK